MNKVAIFGAGIIGQAIYALLKKDNNVLYFFDNISNETEFDGVPVRLFNQRVDFDKVYIAVTSDDAFNSIKKQLLSQGLPLGKIRSYQEVLLYRARVDFMYKYAEQMQSNLRYANAEVGCFQGEFAKEINAAFPNNKLYLFDTFQGFVEPDISSDTVEKSVMEVLSSEFVQTSVQTVIDKMIYPENIIIKQGYFPDTFDIGEERFGFVSVDADLYAPTKSALEIFFPLMADRGLLLVHDYYNNLLPGVRKAVDEFVSHSSTRFLPIGDAMSVAIFK